MNEQTQNMDKAIDLIEKASAKAFDIFSAAANVLTDGIKEYGPQVVDAVLWVVRIDAIQSLLIEWLWFVVCLIILVKIIRGWFYNDWNKTLEDRNTDSADISGLQFLSVVIGVFCCVGIIVSSSYVLDVWKYTAIVKPELYLVKKTMNIVEERMKKVQK